MKIREEQNIPITAFRKVRGIIDKITAECRGGRLCDETFYPLELIARVKSQLRRYVRLGSISGGESHSDIYTTGGLVIDDGQKSVTLDGEQIPVTPTEYGILKFLTSNAGKVFSIEQIYEAAWNEPAYSAENTVAVHIRRIREKIEIDPKNPQYLKVVWGIGYKIEKI